MAVTGVWLGLAGGTAGALAADAAAAAFSAAAVSAAAASAAGSGPLPTPEEALGSLAMNGSGTSVVSGATKSIASWVRGSWATAFFSLRIGFLTGFARGFAAGLISDAATGGGMLMSTGGGLSIL